MAERVRNEKEKGGSLGYVRPHSIKNQIKVCLPVPLPKPNSPSATRYVFLGGSHPPCGKDSR